MPRGPRLDAPGTLQHLIVWGIAPRRIAGDDQDRERLLSRLGDPARETHTAVCTWALMENHAHLLVRSGPGGASRVHATAADRTRHVFQPRPPSPRPSVSEPLEIRELARFLALQLGLTRAEAVPPTRGEHLGGGANSAADELVPFVNNVPYLLFTDPAVLQFDDPFGAIGQIGVVGDHDDAKPFGIQGLQE